MKINKVYKGLIVVFIIQLAVLLYPGISHERVALNGHSYKFKIQAYDPVDPFRGYYLAYIINKDKVHGNMNGYRGTCYITFSQDKEGYTYLDEATKTKPIGKDYVVSYTNEGIYYTTPFDKYYIDEDIAKQADTLMRESLEDCYVVIKSKQGVNAVEGVYVRGKLIEGYFK